MIESPMAQAVDSYKTSCLQVLDGSFENRIAKEVSRRVFVRKFFENQSVGNLQGNDYEALLISGDNKDVLGKQVLIELKNGSGVFGTLLNQASEALPYYRIEVLEKHVFRTNESSTTVQIVPQSIVRSLSVIESQIFLPLLAINSWESLPAPQFSSEELIRPRHFLFSKDSIGRRVVVYSIENGQVQRREGILIERGVISTSHIAVMANIFRIVPAMAYQVREMVQEQ
jgi:hypothetical protein